MDGGGRGEARSAAIYAHGLDSGFSHKKGMWVKAAMLNSSAPDWSMPSYKKAPVLRTGNFVAHGRQGRWLTATSRGREILQAAFDANPDSEEVRSPRSSWSLKTAKSHRHKCFSPQESAQ